MRVFVKRRACGQCHVSLHSLWVVPWGAIWLFWDNLLITIQYGLLERKRERERAKEFPFSAQSECGELMTWANAGIFSVPPRSEKLFFVCVCVLFYTNWVSVMLLKNNYEDDCEWKYDNKSRVFFYARFWQDDVFQLLISFNTLRLERVYAFKFLHSLCLVCVYVFVFVRQSKGANMNKSLQSTAKMFSNCQFRKRLQNLDIKTVV